MSSSVALMGLGSRPFMHHWGCTQDVQGSSSLALLSPLAGIWFYRMPCTRCAADEAAVSLYEQFPHGGIAVGKLLGSSPSLCACHTAERGSAVTLLLGRLHLGQIKGMALCRDLCRAYSSCSAWDNREGSTEVGGKERQDMAGGLSGETLFGEALWSVLSSPNSSGGRARLGT